MKKMLVLSMLTSLCLYAEIRPLVQIGIDLGGESALRGEESFDNRFEVNAGSGFNLDIGMAFRTKETNKYLFTNILLGYKYNQGSLTNDHANISRISLSVLEVYNISKLFYLSAGLTGHLSPTIDAYNLDNAIHWKYDNALGIVLGMGYKYDKNISLGFKATFIDYESVKYGNTMDADSLGMFINYVF